MPSINFVWPEMNIDITSNTFHFLRTFPDESGRLFCAEVSPALKYKGAEFSKFYFTDLEVFKISESVFRISTPKLINIPIEDRDITVTVITPEIFNIPKTLNVGLRTRDSTCHAHLFQVEDVNDIFDTPPVYFSSISGPWNQFFHLIRRALIEKHLGSYAIKCKVLSDAASESQRFHLAQNFFQQKYSHKTYGKQTVCILVISLKDLTFVYHDKVLLPSAIPKIPKSFVYRGADLMLLDLGADVATVCRRIIVACFNGAIPLQLLDYLKDKVVGWPFESRQFERTCLNLPETFESSEIEALKSEIARPISNLIHHWRFDATEAEIRFLFWDSLIDQFLFSCTLDHLKFRPSSEWETKKLFPDLDARMVDLAILFRPKEVEIPILLVEIGKGPLSVNSHKDFSKLIGLMSLSCKKMARELEAPNNFSEEFRESHGANT